jgi:hypothetical protein
MVMMEDYEGAERMMGRSDPELVEGNASFLLGRAMMALRAEHNPLDAAELLKKRAFSNEYDSLIVIAPPKTLGELRKHYHKEVTDRLSGELAKDLTGHPIADIEKALLDA